MAAAYEIPGASSLWWSSIAAAEAESPLWDVGAPNGLELPATEASVAVAPLAAALVGWTAVGGAIPRAELDEGEFAAAGLTITGVAIVEGKGFEAAGEVIAGNGLAEGLPL
jgi:hypothetical protein